MIDSLENDYDRWEMKHCGGGPGWYWTEYYGPIYTNESGIKIQFAETLNYTGAFVDGQIMWTVGFLDWYNIFSYRTRRLRRAFRRMKKHLIFMERTERIEKLRDSL